METDSTIYSIGTALRRARDHDLGVEVLVGGDWLQGVIAAVDGHGVVLNLPPAEHLVVRLEAITAVRVRAPMPWSARPMPTAAPLTVGCS